MNATESMLDRLVSIPAVLLAIVLVACGLYWFTISLPIDTGEELSREHSAVETSNEEKKRERQGFKAQAFRLGYDRGREDFSLDEELPSEAQLRESARPIAASLKVPAAILEEFLDRYAVGYGWGWDNCKAKKLFGSTEPPPGQSP